ncbi:ABC transporter ATP-binding protein [Vibrio europaeus]|uniref:ABC transporter ATP-binding protein n=1 Tax=Vibrio europaeus TaxID=300876 RepID=A0A178J8A9_9VIBR|nr:ABC transporter ATP-binding protein [Vibrio europaeus]MDC5705595.1 ABC transporter ATP-binding protein [Vibrio europaeus]MDC5710874.1 ABC transporter ATP-binding protein [Vibrio europaeus]MDC5715964.1 ABC transporter ATP-binding protein [Vibrio europaeus]MDC5720126.1 ABC transporter ATP-binding protein [Vibrio europaeus]MDC5723987.1 ABC transporter ATP-binding protein [Vibrio europaeus]
MSVLIEARQVTKHYSGRVKEQGEAIKNISFELKAGQVLGLLGHNGAGKSTLIKSLLGAHDYQGDIQVLGLEPISQRAKVMEHLSYISDVNVLPDWMTVRQILRYTAGVHPSFDVNKARAVLEKTDIKLKSKIKSLSKGMKVQLHLAIVISTDTKVLILDEPTLGLDLVYRDTFYRHLLEWFHDGERALIIASHEVSEIEHLLTDVLILKHGQAVLQSSMENIAEDYVIVETNDEQRAQMEALKPLSSERALGSTRWLIRSEQAQQLDDVEKIYNVKLADLFLALQKEAA